MAESPLILLGIPGGDPLQPDVTPYEGPLDFVPEAVVAYSVRALSAAQLGEPLFTLQKGREIPGTTQEFDADAVTGDAPTAAINAFLGLDEGVLTIWNDQAGNDLHLFTTASATTSASGPTFMPDELNDHPAFGDVNGAGTLSTAPGEITLSSAIATVFIVAKGVTLFDMEDGGQRFFSNVTGTHFEGEFKLVAAIAGDTFAADTSALALYVGVVKFNASSAKRNGVALTPTGVANTDIAINFTTAAFFDLADGAGGGQCCEFILYNSELSAGNQLAISQNIAAYYGITL